MQPTILVVDDEPALLGLARVVLDRAGYAVLTAADGPDALARFRAAARVDVVVLDVNIPGLDGWGVLRELRRLRPDLRVVISTGNPGDATAGHRDTPTALLPKPFRPVELTDIVARVLADG